MLRFSFWSYDPQFFILRDFKHFDFVSYKFLVKKFIPLATNRITPKSYLKSLYPFLYLSNVVRVKDNFSLLLYKV